jgi:hypothetical protein
LDSLNWLVEQWYRYGLSGEPEKFDADLTEMRRQLKLVASHPYDVRTKAAA